MNKCKATRFAIWLLITFASTQFSKVSQAQPASAYPDVPLGSWVYPALDKLEQLQDFYTHSPYPRRGSLKRFATTRYEVAIFTLHLRLQKDWSWVDKCPEGKLLGQAGVKDILAAFEREFEPEIIQLLLPPKK